MNQYLSQYQHMVASAPRRHHRGKKYFVGHDGIPSSKSSKGTNRWEEHLGIALWNRFRPGLPPIQIREDVVLTLLDYQFPLKARRDDKGVGKVDLFGVDQAGRAWVIELKTGDNRTDSPLSALEQLIPYAAITQANLQDIRGEPDGQMIKSNQLVFCVMAPSQFWQQGLYGAKDLARELTSSLDHEVKFVEIEMNDSDLQCGMDGSRSTINGHISFSLVGV